MENEESYDGEISPYQEINYYLNKLERASTLDEYLNICAELHRLNEFMEVDEFATVGWGFMSLSVAIRDGLVPTKRGPKVKLDRLESVQSYLRIGPKYMGLLGVKREDAIASIMDRFKLNHDAARKLYDQAKKANKKEFPDLGK